MLKENWPVAPVNKALTAIEKIAFRELRMNGIFWFMCIPMVCLALLDDGTGAIAAADDVEQVGQGRLVFWG